MYVQDKIIIVQYRGQSDKIQLWIAIGLQFTSPGI